MSEDEKKKLENLADKVGDRIRELTEDEERDVSGGASYNCGEPSFTCGTHQCPTRQGVSCSGPFACTGPFGID